MNADMRRGMHIKDDFPLLKEGLHYLDNAATTQKPRAVIEAVKRFYETENATVHRGLYPLSVEATKRFERARGVVADFIGAPTENVIFTSGTTDSINLVAQALPLKRGDEILLTPHEHHANIVPWQQLAKRTGAKVVWCGLNEDLTLDLDDLQKKLTRKTKVLAITHVSNVLGIVNPLDRIIPHAREHGTFVLVDGAQAVQHLDVNVRKLDCDAYAFSGHKLYGPTGIGVLYLKSLTLAPARTGGDMIDDVTEEEARFAEGEPRRFEAGTPNLAGVAGLAAAIGYLRGIGMGNIHANEETLLRHAWDALKQLPRVRLLGPAPGSEMRAGILTFTIDRVPPHDLAELLARRGVCIRAGKHCAHPLHYRLGLREGTNRASFGIYNTKEDVDKLVDGIVQAMDVFS